MKALTSLRAITGLFFLVFGGCASSTPSAEHPEVASTDPSAAAAGGAHRSLPDHCARGKRECVPPPGWVKRLCDDVYPDVAPNMFKQGMRCQRSYMLAR